MAKGKYQAWLSPGALLLIEGWARDGLTDAQIAHNMGISRSTLYEWREKYSDISDALKNGKIVADRMVENALFKRAIGYTYVETTMEALKDADGLPVINDDGDPTLIVTKKVIKQQAPDTTAQIFWLKNRKPGEWANDPHVLELRRKELALREKKIENDDW